MEKDIKKPPRSKVNSKLGYYQLESLAHYLNDELPHLNFHVRMIGRRLIQSVKSTQALSEVGADQIEAYWKSYCGKYRIWFNPLLFPEKSKLSLSILEDPNDSESEVEPESSGDSDSFDYYLNQKKPIKKFKQYKYNDSNQQYQVNEPGQYSNVNYRSYQNQVNEPGQYSDFNNHPYQNQLDKPRQYSNVNNHSYQNQLNKPRQYSNVNYRSYQNQVNEPGQYSDFNNHPYQNQLDKPRQYSNVNNHSYQNQLNKPRQYSNVNYRSYQNQVNEPGQYSDFNNHPYQNQVNKFKQQRRTSSLDYPIEGDKVTDEGIEYGQREGENISHIAFNNRQFREDIDYIPMPSHNENFNSQNSQLKSSKNNYMSLGTPFHNASHIKEDVKDTDCCCVVL
ncbi:hypothetical protein [Piscirickettsia salmonis]|uniref:hypothetical protein n=1 Tax=Piscirickettsia salmonis TaxID=1238 RepID=UPI0007C92F90|nr:hypothetical protein A0O36_01417 [Piscirickettsiaceae bacterium NZ-RLO1]